MLVEKNDKKHLEAIIVLITALIAIWWLTDEKHAYLLYVGAVLGGLHVLSPSLTLYIAKAWYALSEFLGNNVSKVILSVAFFLFMTPLAFFQRLAKKNALQLLKKIEGSYYSDRNHQYKKEDFTKPW